MDVMKRQVLLFGRSSALPKRVKASSVDPRIYSGRRKAHSVDPGIYSIADSGLAPAKTPTPDKNRCYRHPRELPACADATSTSFRICEEGAMAQCEATEAAYEILRSTRTDVFSCPVTTRSRYRSWTT